MAGATPLVFVIGSGRSGTTMLRLMLDSHSQLAIPGESHFIPRFVDRWNSPGGRPEAAEAVASIEKDLNVMGISPQEAARRFESLENSSAAAAVSAIFEIYAENRGKPHWGDKTPDYVWNIPLLHQLFPGAKFVNMIRDGRDVALSYVDQPFGPSGVPAAARFWKRRVTTARREGARLGEDAYLEIRYEELVVDIKREMRRICSFLGLGFEERMIDFPARAREILPPGEPNREKLFHQPMRTARDWRTQMSEGHVRIFEALAGDLLSELSYERRYPRTSPATAVVAGVYRIRGKIRSNLTDIVRAASNRSLRRK